MILIGCGKEKREVYCPAGELYTSSLFKKRKEYAEAKTPDRWFILSAKYGLRAPNVMTEPYDQCLADMNQPDQAAWFGGVVLQICDLLEDHAHLRDVAIEILAGADYAERLVDTLLAVGFRKISWPVKGMGIPQQMRWLKEQIPRVRLTRKMTKNARETA